MKQIEDTNQENQVVIYVVVVTPLNLLFVYIVYRRLFNLHAYFWYLLYVYASQ